VQGGVSYGVNKVKCVGMKKLSGDIWVRSAIDRVANDGRSHMFQVRSDLVRAAGHELDIDPGQVIQGL